MKKKIKPTEKQLEIIKFYWSMFKAKEAVFWGKVGRLEKNMSKATGIKELEFFNSDGDWCGIGNADRTMGLLQREDLES